MRHDLRHLGVQALTHFCAAMVHQNRAIGIDMHQRTGLIEVGHIERDAELQRRQRQPTLEHRALRVKGSHCCTSYAVVAGLLQLGYQFVNDVVSHRLLVRRDVVLGLAVEVDAAHI